MKLRPRPSRGCELDLVLASGMLHEPSYDAVASLGELEDALGSALRVERSSTQA